MVMGNVGGKKFDEASPSGTKNEEEDMECAHGGGAHVSIHPPGPFLESMVQSPLHSPTAYQSPLVFNPQIPMVPLQRPDEIVHRQSIEPIRNETESMPSGKAIPTIIKWTYEGNQVAVEGSWDNWKTREYLQRSRKDFSIMKLLQSGVYHYRFIVDGQWRYALDLPQESDYMGNIFHVLNLQDKVPEVLNDICGSESPSSPVSSYGNTSFSSEDFKQKVPQLSLLPQKAPVDCPSSENSPESLEKPLAAVLNHLYIQKARSDQSVLALSSTQRFLSKYVTVVLYKSMKKGKS